MTLGALSFLFPWLLGALVLLPGLWWLLRVTPPRPQIVRFPAFFLLQGLKTTRRAPAKTPWWLLLLRCLLVAAFIFALAEPVMRLQSILPGGATPVLVAIDNGFAAAANWDKRQERIAETLAQLARAERPVFVLPTAAPADRAAPLLSGPMTAADALSMVENMQPQAWPTDHAAAAATLTTLPTATPPGHAIFFSDGTSRSALASQELATALMSAAGRLDVVTDTTINQPYLLRRADGAPGDLSFEIERLSPQATTAPLMLVALAESGALLDELRFSFAPGEKITRVDWPLAEDLRQKVVRIMLREPQMAAATYLTDAQWRQRPVGVIADMTQKDNASFLNEVYYLRRALETDSTLKIDSVEGLLAEERAVLIWPDSAPLTAAERVRVLEWVEAGGFLIRFAGPALAANPDDALLPVALRQGQRALEGSITWEKPLRLGALADNSPFYGLDIPEDVTVTRQVLANPEPETFSRTWLQLADGTPLITGGEQGKGSIALVHTTAGPDWSTFAYSGLYVDVLRRMVALSRGIADYKGTLLLPPLMVMDGFGRLQAPAANSVAGLIDVRADYEAGPRTPPGIYGDHQQFHVYRLGDSLSGLYALPSLPSGVNYLSYAKQGESSHKDMLLKLAIILLLTDLVATLALRGLLPRLKPVAMLLAFLSLVMTTTPAAAQDEALKTSEIYLAYVETGDSASDAVSRNGLAALAELTTARTSIRVKGVDGVDPEVDALHTYPFLYWPMVGAQRPLSLSAAQAVQNYIARGGMIVFDTRDQQFGDTTGQKLGESRLRDLTASLQIPALMPLEKGHILSKSFYLLDSFPGAFTGGEIWVEKEPNPNFDDVTSVIIGPHNWAAAWTRDPADRARLPVTPGGEEQREMAYRFGINLVMVALAGNYKADQVHVPFILQRMGQ